VLVALDDPGGEALLEEVAATAVARVEAARVAAVQAVHPGGEADARRLDDQVVVRAEQAVRVELPAVSADADQKQRGERAPVDVVAEDVEPAGAARGDVVDAVGQVAARHSRHAPTLRAGATAREGPSVFFPTRAYEQ
jgi:hypothetical protein